MIVGRPNGLGLRFLRDLAQLNRFIRSHVNLLVSLPEMENVLLSALATSSCTPYRAGVNRQET